MYFWQSLILFLFLDYHLALASTTESQCVDTKFNTTSATCYDPKDDNIDPDKMWPVKVPSKGSCYDKDGVRYSYYSTLTSCCGCFTYYCYYDRNTKGYFMYWRLRTISPYCCQDNKGVVYPPDEVISTEPGHDKCATEKTVICKYNREWNRLMGTITESYTATKCCLDDDGLHPVNTTKLDPSTCSQRTCRPGNPTSLWSSCPVIPGGIDCCPFNDTLIANGDVVQTQSGMNVTCCDGQMVVKYDVTTTAPKNCTEIDAIHSSIGFAIDNTGSVSSSSVGVMALSNGLIDNIVALNYMIPKWVLVTFNDYPSTVPSKTTETSSSPTDTPSPSTEADIALNTDLRIVTDKVSLFKSSLNNITFSGGGDGPERATQGLWVTLDNLPKHGIALVFTDHQSKDLDMESALIELRDAKNIKIFVVLAPKYRGTVGDASWNLYTRLSEGRIYNMKDFNATQFLNEVVQVVGETCEENIPSVQ